MMTKDEAITVLKSTTVNLGRTNGKTLYVEAMNMAISALQAQNDGGSISRQAAIDAVNSGRVEEDGMHLWRYERNETLDAVVELLEAVPSVQPEKVNEQIRWERDIAVQQLQALGYGLGEKIRTDNDTISRVAAIDEAEEWIEAVYCGHDEKRERDAIKHVINGIKHLPSTQPDNSCDGCKYENADDGVLVPCGFCKRSHPDNYERRTDDGE